MYMCIIMVVSGINSSVVTDSSPVCTVYLSMVLMQISGKNKQINKVTDFISTESGVV